MPGPDRASPSCLHRGTVVSSRNFPRRSSRSDPDTGSLLTQAFYSFHSGGVNVCVGDGSVRFVRDSIAPNMLAAMVTARGGEVASFD